MFKKLSKALTRLSEAPARPAAQDEKPPSLTAAALILIEAAVMDGRIDDSERQAVTALLQARFNLSEAEAGAAVEAAEADQKDAVDIYQPLRDLKDALSHEERIEILVMLWLVVLADGREDHLETSLMRRAAGLLYVSDQENGRARKLALARAADGRRAGANQAG